MWLEFYQRNPGRGHNDQWDIFSFELRAVDMATPPHIVGGGVDFATLKSSSSACGGKAEQHLPPRLRPFYFRLYNHHFLQLAIPAFDTLSQRSFIFSSFPVGLVRKRGHDGSFLAFLTGLAMCFR